MFQHLNWDQVHPDRVSDLQTKQVIHTTNMSLVRLLSKKGATAPLHNHVQEQAVFLISGHFRFDVGGKAVELVPGETLTISSNVPHSAEALADSETLEVFSPPREDWKK